MSLLHPFYHYNTLYQVLLCHSVGSLATPKKASSEVTECGNIVQRKKFTKDYWNNEAFLLFSNHILCFCKTR